ncbi:hypothetical protein [Kordia jejudonensis]|uniref:hypothetical protein n=1 Tax=Kordia jejudonensis TaxID=1348245 RepID=UPI000629A7D0|nr:hypothetical protein [Kordia jejudonensis]
MEYSVQAKENSVTDGTGKEAGTYQRGSLVIITSNPEDQWYLADNQGLDCNADGLSVSDYTHARYTKDGTTINLGTMVGSIDDGNSFFPVGTICELSITSDNTQLKLYCWDSDKVNNSGAINAYVQSR